MFPWFGFCVLIIDLVAYQRGSLPGGWPTRGVAPSLVPFVLYGFVFMYCCSLDFIINLVFPLHCASGPSLLSPQSFYIMYGCIFILDHMSVVAEKKSTSFISLSTITFSSLYIFGTCFREIDFPWQLVLLVQLLDHILERLLFHCTERHHLIYMIL